ncbi:uncharacterized protein BDZ99DRAFT_567780 [Mytilinidion resinicola]|uniref:Uncharacterized protein n=1 Tax=Mytilinidion resinicola TaxID=574789 RepID=A0A6A6Z1D3_9PEZI|nr:uncharacterized protein BDZ99DRAFT_567780 [Mytilinidion resinicola]KAF2814094.1 hypothetical protein BDZ99DRAFT_567780 [Mytilinidion resinicola]
MIRYFISFLTLGALITTSVTHPAPAPTPSSIDDAHYQAVQEYKNTMKCTIFDPPDPKTSISQCNDVCGEAVAKAIAAGQMGSTTCLVLGGDIKWEVVSGNLKVAPAQCSCNNNFLNQFADLLMEALPIIAEIGCDLLMGMLQLVVEVGALAIPGVGEAIDGAMIAGIEAAKLISYSVDAGEAGASVFSNWLTKGCGKSYLPPNVKKAFDIFNSVNNLILPKGFKIPPKVPKGGKKPKAPKTKVPNDDPKTAKDGPKTNAPSETKAPPKSTPKATKASHATTMITSPPSTKDPHKSASNKACTKKQKRAPPGKEPGNEIPDDGECDDPSLHITKITKSNPVLKTITKDCDFKKWPQACYHYYSAIQNDDRMSSAYTCRDDNRSRNGGSTRDWKSQHALKGWKDFTKPAYKFWSDENPKKKPNCQLDEWPPAYFVPPNPNPNPKKGEYKPPVVVRWIPGSENGGVASLWNKYCDDEDGGFKNGQLLKQYGQVKKPPTGKKFGDVNERLVKLIRPGEEVVKKGKDKKATTTTEFEAEYTRAVFEISFDKDFKDFPTKENDWGLRENPCWPEDIVPNDPGFVVFTDDPWYKTAGSPKLVAELKKQKVLYKKAPSADMVKKAKERQKGNPSDDKPVERSIELIDDGGLAVRGTNTSRRLTPDEIRQNLQIIRCADSTCSEERKGLRDEGEEALVISGTTIGLPALPSVNVDSIPTIMPRAYLEPKDNTRTSVSPELPMSTKESSSYATLRRRKAL